MPARILYALLFKAALLILIAVLLFRKALAEWNENWPQSRGTEEQPTLEDLHQELDRLAAPRD